MNKPPFIIVQQTRQIQNKSIIHPRVVFDSTKIKKRKENAVTGRQQKAALPMFHAEHQESRFFM
jgi:hypothetical protein